MAKQGSKGGASARSSETAWLRAAHGLRLLSRRSARL